MILYKYRIIEYSVKKMTNREIEYAKTLHETNSTLFMYLIVLCFKINHIKYEVIKIGEC